MNCKNCNAKLVPIWYGNPTYQEIAIANRDEIALGGKVFKKYTHYCYTCNNTYPSKED